MCINMSVAKSRVELEAYYDSVLRDGSFEPQYVVSGYDHPKFPVILQESFDFIDLVSWGLIPHWVKDFSQAKQIRNQTLNARTESLRQKSSYKYSVDTHRCVIISDGYFEPHHQGKNTYPFYISRRDNRLFGIAGIYAVWNNPETGIAEKSFSLITKPADKLLAEVHNKKQRMPAILPPGLEKEWLRPDLTEKQMQLFLQPAEHRDFSARSVSRELYSKSISSLEKNRPGMLAGVEYPELDLRL